MEEAAKSSGGKVREFIAFRIGEQEFGVDVKAVREIRGWTPATRMPHTPNYILGVINLRGTVLPIVDLAARMGFGSAEPTSRHAIMVVEMGKQTVGLLVEGVSEIFGADESQIQPPPDAASAGQGSFVLGIIPSDERMITCIALDQVVPSTEELAA
jgi:purine-binding chemotaxis protein CheW